MTSIEVRVISGVKHIIDVDSHGLLYRYWCKTCGNIFACTDAVKKSQIELKKGYCSIECMEEGEKE